MKFYSKITTPSSDQTRQSPLKNKRASSAQQNPSQFLLGRCLFDNWVSTRSHQGSVAATGQGRAIHVPRDLVQLMAFLTLCSPGHTVKPHEAELIFASLVSKLRTNKIRERAELF